MCELVGLFILNDLCNEYGKDNIGLYRDDGLAIFKDTSGPQAERIRKDITRRFKTHGLNITIQTNMKIVNYLDGTFDLTNGNCCPYRKPNDHPQYINTKSNHPPNIIKQIPASINRRISDNSSNEDAFNKAKPRLQLSFESQRLNGNTDLQHKQTTCTTSKQQTKKRHLVQPSFQ